MRSLRPEPGNPWPHDMVLTVQDHPQQVLEMLWLREAYGLQPGGDDLPPLLVETPEPVTEGLDGETLAAWERAWARLWPAVIAHAGREVDPRQFERLQEVPGGSPERAAILQEMFGPSWTDEQGRGAFEDPSYGEWERKGMAASRASRPPALSDTPERRDLDALIAAWRAGLTKVVTIPCRGEYSRRLGPNALLVTDATRADSARYRTALRSFAGQEAS